MTLEHSMDLGPLESVDGKTHPDQDNQTKYDVGRKAGWSSGPLAVFFLSEESAR